MPYRKKYKSSRPGYKACGRMVFGDARKALAVAQGLKRLLNVEIKNHDVTQTSVTIIQTPVIVQLSNIPSGDTTISRDGAQCKMVGINLNYFLTVDPTTPRTVVRIVLLIDRQTNQIIYNIADFFDSTVSQLNVISPRNLNNLHRFIVLYDQTHMLSLDTPTVTVRKYIKRDVLLRYDASTPSIADSTQNSLSLLQVTNEGTNQPIISSFCRIRFVDN